MKKILTCSLLALFVCILASCAKDEVFYKFADGEIAATFQSSSLKIGELTEADNGKVSVPMYRGNTRGAASVAVVITGGEGVFTPSATSFNFADGENVAYIDFTFDFSTLGGKPMSVTIEMENAEDCASMGVNKTSFTLARKLTWEKVGEGVYYTDFFGEGWYQDLYKAKEGDFYMLEGCWYKGTDFTFFCNGTTVDWYAAETGYSYGSYGPVHFSPTKAYVESDSDGIKLVIECDYVLPSIGNYVLYQGFEEFVFPEGFSF